MKLGTLITLLLLLSAGPAMAQDATAEGAGAPMSPVAFFEASGGYGLQLGEQVYMPSPDGTYRNPLTNGYAFGLTAGWEFTPGLALIGNWEYSRSQSRDGEVTNALDRIDGLIDFHTLSLGLRWTRQLGPGFLYGELAAGVVLPFETTVLYEYDVAMSAIDVAGTGKMIDEYNLGFGAYGQAGYQLGITRDLYVSAGLRVKSYQSDNDGKSRRLENFVPDMTNPAATDVTIEYDSDGRPGTEPPRTYSAQDLRLLLGVGWRL
jgi:hypothetical protein